MRVVFMGTPEFAVPALEAVHGAHEIVAVYTQPDRPVGRGLDLRPSPVKAKALQLGLGHGQSVLELDMRQTALLLGLPARHFAGGAHRRAFGAARRGQDRNDLLQTLH